MMVRVFIIFSFRGCDICPARLFFTPAKMCFYLIKRKSSLEPTTAAEDIFLRATVQKNGDLGSCATCITRGANEPEKQVGPSANAQSSLLHVAGQDIAKANIGHRPWIKIGERAKDVDALATA